MARLHPLLEPYASARHIKQFSKALYVLTDQLSGISATVGHVEVEKFSAEKGAIRRFLEGIDINSVDQSMTVSSEWHGIHSQIIVSMINTGWLLPLHMFFILPAPTRSEAACRRSAFGRKWSSHPVDTRLTDQLDRIMPKVRKNHNWYAMICKVGLYYSLEPMDDDTSLLLAHTGFKQGFSDKPKFGIEPYFNAAENVRQILEAEKS